MPIIDFEKQKEELINNISIRITEEKELEALINLFNRLMNKKAVLLRKAQRANLSMTHPYYSIKRVSSIISLQSTNNITHEEALQELDKMTETWK